MDFDERKFDRLELQDNLALIGLHEVDMDDLLKRTTKNTRRGTEFSFKPYEIMVGVLTADAFHYGFRSTVDRSDSVKSAVWIRFHEQVRRCYHQRICTHAGIIWFKAPHFQMLLSGTTISELTSLRGEMEV